MHILPCPLAHYQDIERTETLPIDVWERFGGGDLQRAAKYIKVLEFERDQYKSEARNMRELFGKTCRIADDLEIERNDARDTCSHFSEQWRIARERAERAEEEEKACRVRIHPLEDRVVALREAVWAAYCDLKEGQTSIALAVLKEALDG